MTWCLLCNIVLNICATHPLFSITWKTVVINTLISREHGVLFVLHLLHTQLMYFTQKHSFQLLFNKGLQLVVELRYHCVLVFEKSQDSKPKQAKPKSVSPSLSLSSKMDLTGYSLCWSPSPKMESKHTHKLHFLTAKFVLSLSLSPSL
jgi:hypothetical protein